MSMHGEREVSRRCTEFWPVDRRLQCHGHVLDTMRCLLTHGADVDALDDDHATPLHLASLEGCVKGARLLLEHGANVHLENKEGKTPFQVASAQGHEKITQLLSEHLQSQQKI